ncbi:MAG TPA: hypothetical protein VMU90_05790 [Solirubrobacteraceae bacterium]|nr:hypothetical protein [Solirubrobacteraceae bacterium]
MEAHTLTERQTGSPPSATGPEPGRGPTAPPWREWLRSPLTLSVAACVALAALSVAVLPTVPSYDPWSWVVWGREVVDPHLSFSLGGGPSWKPLPVIFTTVFGLFGGAAPTLWVAAARAGGLLALPAAYRLARRLLPGAPAWAGVTAGLIAVAGVVLTQDWFYYMYRGTSEPLLIATSLWAVDRHLAGHRESAFVLGVATSLMRPEAWPFLGIYAIWLWLREPSLRTRALLVLGLAAVPFFWFVPPWISTGHPFLAASHAHQYNGHLGSSPFITVLHRGVDIQVLPALIAAVAALGLARWRRVDRLVLWLAGLVVAWWVVVVGMTLVGYPGLERFYLPAAALICVLAGVGVVGLAQLGGEAVRGVGGRVGGARVRGARVRGARFPAWVVPAALTLVLVGVSVAVPATRSRAAEVRSQERIASRAVTRLDQLSAAVAAVGGHRGVYPCRSSFASVNHSAQTALAFKLHVTLGRVGTAMRHQGLLFLGPHDSIDGGAPAINRRLTRRQLIATVGAWQVYRLTVPGASTRCVGGRRLAAGVSG